MKASEEIVNHNYYPVYTSSCMNRLEWYLELYFSTLHLAESVAITVTNTAQD